MATNRDPLFLILRAQSGQTPGELCYVPLMIDGQAVAFFDKTLSVRFLQTLANEPEQTDWSEAYGYRSGEGRSINYAIREVTVYSHYTDALAAHNESERRRVLRGMSKEERTILGLPDPD